MPPRALCKARLVIEGASGPSTPSTARPAVPGQNPEIFRAIPVQKATSQFNRPWSICGDVRSSVPCSERVPMAACTARGLAAALLLALLSALEASAATQYNWWGLVKQAWGFRARPAETKSCKHEPAHAHGPPPPQHQDFWSSGFPLPKRIHDTMLPRSHTLSTP